MLALTIGRRTDQGWAAVTDRGELVEVPAGTAAGLVLATGQRVLADLDDVGAVVSVSIGGTSVGLPRT